MDPKKIAENPAPVFAFTVNRLEVIDHSRGGHGVITTKWRDDNFSVTLELQDDSRTLKIFVSEINSPLP